MDSLRNDFGLGHHKPATVLQDSMNLLEGP